MVDLISFFGVIVAFGVLGIIAFFAVLIWRSHHAWVELYQVFDNKTKRTFKRARFTRDKAHLKVRGDLYPVEEKAADEYKGKPCYTYAIVQPGVPIPLHKLEREIRTQIYDDEGDFVKERVDTVKELLPTLGYNARAAFANAAEEADRIYREKETFRMMLLKNLPYVISAAIIIVGLVFIYLITGNLNPTLTCRCLNASAPPIY